MKNTVCGFLTALLFGFVSCDNKTDENKLSALSEFDNYFEAEIRDLEQSELPLTKTLIHQGKTEEIIIEKPDWAKELVPFTETISNQSARIQSFSRDSIVTGAVKVLTLSARDSAASLRSLAVYTTGGIHDSIVLIKKVTNVYYSSSDTLTYYGRGNYVIKAENLPGLGKKIGFLLEGKAVVKR